MMQVFLLTLRQVTGLRRVIILLALALLPAGVTLLIRALSDADTTATEEEFIGAVVVAIVLPLTVAITATPAFGNEVEDRTLGFLTMKPVGRWEIVVAKLVGVIIVSGALVGVSAVVTGWLVYDAASTTFLAFLLGIAIGVIGYSAIFTWLGLVTGQALAFAIVYVFVWEGVASNILAGVKYLSINGYTLSVMEWASDGEIFTPNSIDGVAALIGAAIVLVLFALLTLHRLKNMDVP